MAQGVTPVLVAMFALGAALLVAFIAIDRRAADPLAQLDAFRNVPFSVNLVPCSSAFPL